MTHTVSLYNSSPRSGDVTIGHNVSHAGPLAPDHAAGPLVLTTGHLTPDVSGLSTRLNTTEEPELGLCPALGSARQCTVAHQVDTSRTFYWLQNGVFLDSISKILISSTV